MDLVGPVACEYTESQASLPASHGITGEDLLRANVYRFLAIVLSAPPTPEVLTLLKGIDIKEQDQGAMAVSWRLLKLAGGHFSSESLDDEFHALFIGMGRGDLVPFGSWYITGFLMEKPLSLLRDDLKCLGIEREQGVFESEDHIAALCETMAIIINFPAEIDQAAQRTFFNRHLAPWAGAFFNDLQKAKPARFYRAVGHVGHSFIDIEKQYLSMLV